MSCSCTGVSISARSGYLRILPVSPSWSAWSQGAADDRLGRGTRLERDDVVRLDLIAGDVHAAAVHVEVAVADELAGLRARGGEAEPVDDVVEPRLEHPEQVL